MHAAVRVTTNELIQLPTYDALKQAQSQASDELVIGTYNPETGVFTSDDDKLVVDFGVEQMTTIATEVVSPEVLAAKDVRVLDIIEDMLLDQQYDATMTDDIVLAVQEYLQDEKTNKSALALIADNAKLRGVFKFAQLVRNSEPFAALVAENTPEITVSKGEVIMILPENLSHLATQDITKLSQDEIEDSLYILEEQGYKTHPIFKKYTEQRSRNIEAIRAKQQPAIAQQSQAMEASRRLTGSSQKSSKGSKSPKKAKTQQQVETIIGEATDCPQDIKKAHKTSKSKQVRPMPTIASLEALEAMDRKALGEAIKALNDNRATSTRANSSNLLMKETLAKYCLGITYVAPAKPVKAPKAPKTKKPVEVIALPEGLTWQEVLNMKYRSLQQLGKAFRSHGHQMPRLNSKGDDIRTAIKEAMRSMGYDIAETTLTAAPKIDLNTPNWTEIKLQKELERKTTEALKLNNEDAKVALELAVAR